MPQRRLFRPRTVLCAALAALYVGCHDPSAVVVGVTSSATFVDAARLAVVHELAQGPIPGFDTVMMEESTNRSAPAIEVADRLVGVDGLVAVVGHSNSAASLAAAPIYNGQKVVQIAPTASAVVFSEAGPFSFRLVPPDDQQGRFLAAHIRKRLPEGGKLAVFYVNDDYGRGLRKALLSNLDSARFPVVVDLPHVEGDVQDDEVTYAADALRATRPELVVWLARGSVLARFIEGFREILPEAPILGGDATGGGGAVALAGGRWGVISHATYVDMEGSEAIRTFGRHFRERFGRDATGPDALTYDATRLLMAGIRSGARSGEELRAFLLSLGHKRPPYSGVTGEIAFDDRGDVNRSYIMTVLGGRIGQ